MDEETLFNYTDELMMQAREDHDVFVKKLERKGYDTEDLCEEIRMALSNKSVCWSRVFILAVMGVALDGID